MRTTSKLGSTYLGVDLAPRVDGAPDAFDVCGLDARGGKLAARFWTWTADDGGASNVEAILTDIVGARGTVLGTVTGSGRALCESLRKAGIPVGDPCLNSGVGETCAADVWSRLAACTLPDRDSAQGAAARRTMLETLGVALRDQPLRGGQLDACLCALLAAADDGALVEGIGEREEQGQAVLLKLEDQERAAAVARAAAQALGV